MKQVIVLIGLLLSFSATEAQISVRVKNSPNSKEIDVKTGNKPSPGKDVETKPSANNSKPQSTGETKAAAKTDTTAKPVTTVAVDESYNGPAKVQLKSFWRHLEKLRAGTGTASEINNAERMLKQVKEKDPAYNIQELETEVASYRDNADKEAKAKSDAAGKAEEEKNYFKNIWAKMVGVYSTGIDIQPGVVGETYLNRVKEINLAEYKEKRKNVTDASPKSYPALIDNMLADYDEYVKRADRLKWNVVEMMTKSRNAANPQDKTALLKSARYECEAILIISPNNTPFKQKLDEINKLLGVADAEAAKFFTSDFHRENLNKIIWSTKPLVIGKEKDMGASVTKNFKTGDYIFGTVYLGVNVKDAMNNNTNLRVRIKVDNGTAVWGGDLSYIELPLTAQGKSFFQFALLPDAQWMQSNYAPYIAEENWTLSYFLDELARSGDVSHNITCEFIFPTNKIDNIKGDFSLDLGSGSSEIKSMAGKLSNEMMATRTLPKAGMNNAAIEQQMVTAANNLGWNDKFIKAIITSSSWNISKNDLTGAILYRYLGAVCTIKSPDGKCYYQEFSFRQDYTGGGNYSSTIKFNSYGGKREIGCDKIK